MENHSELKTLTPNDHAENIDIYKISINEGLRDSKVKNIALSGSYGSGKSSIIETFFKNRSDYLHVSLANFEKTNNNKIETSNIEKNIINQILYQIPPKRIPLTNFRVKRELTNLEKGLFSTEFVLFMGFVFSLVNLTSLIIVKILFFGILSTFLFWNIMTILKYLPIKKLNLKLSNLETELLKENDELFERYADEVIYLLENSGKKVLIVEDLDRFDNTNIFSKLRELNIKVNNKLNQEGKKKFTFIYAIRDDLFSSGKDRTKFFDLIIPVIPYINSINSFEKMKDYFHFSKDIYSSENLKKIEISDELLFLLSFYIDDTRILSNIYNEFIIFRNQIRQKDDNKLLTLIAYKNLFNRDFEKLKFKKGRLYRTISSSEEYKQNIKRKIKDIEKKMSDKDMDIVLSNNSEFSQKDEIWYKLNQKYIGKAHDQIKSSKLKDLIPVDFVKLLRLPRSVEYKQLDDFIFRFISQGYIDKDYENYINYSYGFDNDSEFLANIVNVSDFENYDLVLYDIQGKIKCFLNDADYEKKAILNYSLVNNFLKNGSDEDKLKKIFKTAVKKNTPFLENYLNTIRLNNPKREKVLKIIADAGLKLDFRKLNKVDKLLIDKGLYKDESKTYAELKNEVSLLNYDNSEYEEKLFNHQFRNRIKKIVDDSMNNTSAIKQTEANLYIGFQEFGLKNYEKLAKIVTLSGTEESKNILLDDEYPNRFILEIFKEMGIIS